MVAGISEAGTTWTGTYDAVGINVGVCAVVFSEGFSFLVFDAPSSVVVVSVVCAGFVPS